MNIKWQRYNDDNPEEFGYDYRGIVAGVEVFSFGVDIDGRAVLWSAFMMEKLPEDRVFPSADRAKSYAETTFSAWLKDAVLQMSGEL